MIWSSSINKKEFKWLTQYFGYKYGIFGNIKWKEQDALHIMNEWIYRYHLSHIVDRVVLHKINLQIDATDKIVSDLILRTISRPSLGINPNILGKPLPSEYQNMIDKYFS